MIINKHFYADQNEQLEAIVKFVDVAIESALEEKKAPSIYLSGGSTPKKVYEKIATKGKKISAIDFAMVDERWVNYDNEASNEAFIHRCFTDNKYFELLGMKNSAESASSGWQESEKSFRYLPDCPTLTILGMGLDGHTASFFPGALGIEEALDPKNKNRLAVIEAKRSEVTGEYTERMTLTLAHILRSNYLMLLIQGQEKLNLIEDIILHGDRDKFPVSAVLHQDRIAVDIFWCP